METRQERRRVANPFVPIVAAAIAALLALAVARGLWRQATTTRLATTVNAQTVPAPPTHFDYLHEHGADAEAPAAPAATAGPAATVDNSDRRYTRGSLP